MGYAEKRGTGSGAYWRGRYRIAPGKYGTVCGPDGAVIKFGGKREAERAATAEETAAAIARREAEESRISGRVKFGPYAGAWLAAQRLAGLDEDTTDGYKSIIECHFLDRWQDTWLDEITRDGPGGISEWEQAQRERYAPVTVRGRRQLLAMILADAVDDPGVTLAASPAVRRRGRGRKAPPLPAADDDDLDADDEDDDDGAGKVITTPLGALLIAERAAVMSGRDDEFTALILAFYTGLRWGELTGLETRYCKTGKIRILWALRERKGRFTRKRPKFGKTRSAEIPPFLGRLIADHIARADPQPCPCHGRTYMFSGTGQARGSRKAVTLAAVAAEAGVSQGTVSEALNHPGKVAAVTRGKIEEAIAVTGYERGKAARSPHWYRSAFGQWIWGPAVSGWYPPKSPHPRRPVPLLGAPWPGVPVRGRGNDRRADACWLPLAEGMTPHGMRHAHKSLMAELRIPEVLSHDRLGHEMPGIAGVYSHPTPAMQAELMAALAVCWEKSLGDRLALCPRSPVPVLDRLLSELAGADKFSQDSPG